MQKKLRLAAMSALAGLVLAVPSGEVRALGEGRGAGGEPYLTGGIGGDERDVLLKRRQNFNVWITTAAKKSGAFLADVRVRVVDAAGGMVLETPLEGPSLFIALKPGQYSVEATLEQQKQVRAVAVDVKSRHELNFYFDVEAQTTPPEADANAAAPKQPAISAKQRRQQR